MRSINKKLILLAAAIIFACGSFKSAAAQCIDASNGETAVVFNNGSSYEVTFYVDWVELQTLVSHTMSREITIASGPHLLAGRAITPEGRESWVFSENDFPAGKICTWTVTDPQPQVVDTRTLWNGRFL